MARGYVINQDDAVRALLQATKNAASLLPVVTYADILKVIQSLVLSASKSTDSKLKPKSARSDGNLLHYDIMYSIM